MNYNNIPGVTKAQVRGPQTQAWGNKVSMKEMFLKTNDVQAAVKVRSHRPKK